MNALDKIESTMTAVASAQLVIAQAILVLVKNQNEAVATMAVMAKQVADIYAALSLGEDSTPASTEVEASSR